MTRKPKVTVKIHRDALKGLTTMSEVHEALGEIAQDVQEDAQDIARAEAYNTGAYCDGIVVRDPGTANGEMQIVATDWKSNILEARVHTMQRAAAGAGQ